MSAARLMPADDGGDPLGRHACWRHISDALADIAEDAELLARLHDRELDAQTLSALRSIEFPQWLALRPRSAIAREAWRAMRAALAAVPPAPTSADLDALAADYAAIYLTGASHASPCESYWLDADRLLCQQPMFDVRATYRDAGLMASDWRTRPDDHLVLQLLFAAHALRGGEAGRAQLSAFLDLHLLRWLPEFAARIAAQPGHPFYAALLGLTSAWCQNLQTCLKDR